MGKRKSKQKIMVLKRDTKLPKTFKCLFCNHENSIDISIYKDMRIGVLSCRVCEVKWSTHSMEISREIDIYSAWVDKCQEANEINHSESSSSFSED